MKKITRATVATGLTATLLLSGAAGAFATTDSTTLTSDAKIRIWGPSRAETSVEAVKRLETDNAVSNEGEEVFLVGGDAFADPLALTTLSDCLNSPVLMTANANTLSASVNDKLAQIKPARVTIVGGTLSVSDAVEQQVRKAVPNAKVTRIAGETRYDTSADLAAYTVACYNGDYSTLQGLRDDIYDANQAEATYQAALKNYEATRKTFATENNKLANLNKKAQDIAEKIAEVTKTLKPTGDTASLTDAVNTAKSELDAAAKARGDQAAANAFITEQLSNLGAGNSTLDIKSTIADYESYFQAKGDTKAVSALNDAIAVAGVSKSDTVETAIATSNDKLADAQSTFADKSEAYAAAVEKLQTALDDADANKAVVQRLVQLQRELKKANQDVADQTAVVADAEKKMNAAKDALVEAVNNRPEPNTVADKQKQLRTQLNAQAAKGGKATVFLADGTRFPDALVGGPAAAQTDGVILLSQGSTLPSATNAYLKSAKSQVVTVGVPAAQAVKGDRVITLEKEFSGATRYDTAAAITKYYFGQGTDANHEAPLNKHPMAIASGENFADAVLASNYIAQYDGGVLLTQKNTVPTATLNYLNNFSDKDLAIRAFGGPVWLSDGVLNTLSAYAGR
ncbi:cell wall-binding repeat-containing protein [Nanchangia anserum]|uniref:Cell wall-binding repeat-containing protein n=1 Tax=Nanchangia anserum TaxID=2692125 RepID=A0A8I0GCJ0_9ACTO|nr:cell wall-binding repeat-containing protein [Nanchangia anserum]MBD3689650.1 cell wall-binding repeat-containing protein [Nanchangia anserum]QOX81832.1 cell wall-binding repeat-containing protein [Nanchangia anserum]